MDKIIVTYRKEDDAENRIAVTPLRGCIKISDGWTDGTTAQSTSIILEPDALYALREQISGLKYCSNCGVWYQSELCPECEQ